MLCCPLRPLGSHDEFCGIRGFDAENLPWDVTFFDVSLEQFSGVEPRGAFCPTALGN